MVNNGRPSRGCQMCRSRRIKCDESRPTCKRCAESRRECPGYKSEHDILFRDETPAIKRRVQRSGKKAGEQRNTNVKEATSGNSPSSTASLPSASLGSQAMPQSPLDEQASCHFISNFVLVPRQMNARGFMDFLVPLKKMEDTPQHFKFAFDACALASLNSRVGMGNEFEKETTGKYIQALSFTFSALRDPQMAKDDSTLAAVLLLGLFEALRPTRSLLPWGSHIEGANQIVKARGLEQQLRTSVGRGMFIAVRTQMIIHNTVTSARPSMGVDWWMSGEAKNLHATECQRLNIGLRDLEAEANQLLGASKRSPLHDAEISDLLARAQAHDLACDNWERNLPDYFEPEAIAWEDQSNLSDDDLAKAEIYPGRIDAYHDLWALSVRNLMRCARLSLFSIITRCASRLSSQTDFRSSAEYSAAARTCTATITDIIASIPYQLGCVSKRTELMTSLSTFGCGEDSAQKGLGGYFAMWHLACICVQDFTTDSQRVWARGRLQYIASELGVRSAKLLTRLDLRVPSMLIEKDEAISSPTPQVPSKLILRDELIPGSPPPWADNL